MFRFTISLTLCACGSAFAQRPGQHSDAQGSRATVPAVPVVITASDEPPIASDGAPRGTPNWVALGPHGGDVQDVAISPTDSNLMLAGTAPAGSSGGGLYRSTDGGASWTRNATVNASVYDVEFSPDGSIYAASIDGLWKSTNAGVNWTRLNLGTGINRQIFDVTIDPTNANVLWAGVADAGGGQPINVTRSTNAGTNWTNVTPPLGAPQSCRAIAVDPTHPDNVYACFGGAFGGGQVWVTSNGTAAAPTWTNRSAGLPNNPMNAIIHDGTRVLVGGGQAFGSQFVGVYASTNQGQNWTPLHDNTWPSLIINDITVDRSNPSFLLVATGRSGVFRSTNGGTNWQFGIGQTSATTANSVRFAPGSSTRIVVGASSRGVLQSSDGGDHFVPATTGIIELNVFSIAANPHSLQELALTFQGANDGGVYTSLNGGQTWTLESTPATRWAGGRFNYDGTLYALSTGPSSVAPEGVYRRNPNSGIWVSLGPDQGPLFESELFVFRGSRTNPDLLMTAGNDFGVAGFEPTIWRSTNAGGHWDKVYEGSDVNDSVQDLQIVEDGTNMTMLACFRDFGAVQDGGALRSVNGGQTWDPALTGLPSTAQCYSLSPSPADIHTFVVANRDATPGQGGVWRTTNVGDNWSNTGFTQPAGDVACDEHDNRVLYLAVTANTRVLRSIDSGATFQPFNTNLPTGITVNDLVYVGGTSPRLLAATTRGTYVNSLIDACLGDLNFDRSVGLGDLTLLLSHFGTERGALYADGDLTGDGDVDLSDLTVFLANFGDTCP